jgi:pyridoxal phosphate enzyme (YggS family)
MTPADARSILKDRLSALEDRIRAACERAGRAREEVKLVAVTKYVSAEFAAMLPELGVFDLGESRPQELWRKATALPKQVRWHLVGHLQRNKIDKTLPLVQLIHSVDSVRLVEALNAEAAKQSRKVDVLLELNLSREPNKHGFDPDELPEVVNEVRQATHVTVRGLMTMAAETDDPEICRATFSQLREWRDRIRSQWTAPEVAHLSMGMTNDFEVAIEEGATLIRVGSALFEGLSEPQS